MKDNTEKKQEVQETTLDAEMEAAAMEVAASPLNDAGEPTTPILDFNTISEKFPNYEWIDIPFQGKKHAVKVRKGDVIDFMGSLDDADILALEEIFNDADENIDTSNMSLREQLHINNTNKTYQKFVLTNFIFGVTDENFDDLPKELKRGMMDAYDRVNGISETKTAVDNVKKK